MDSYGGNYEDVASGDAAPNSSTDENGTENGTSNAAQNDTSHSTSATATTTAYSNSNGKRNSNSSMTEDDERARRASIKAIMADVSIPAAERRRSIQHLMDGRRNSAERQKSIDVGVNNALVSKGGNPSSLIDMARAMVESCPPCTHYDRKCTIISPCCGAAFGCRICHDECPVLPPAKYGVHANAAAAEECASKQRHPRSSSLPGSWTSMPESTHHEIDRFAIREIICRVCFTRQTSKTNECKNMDCLATFGEYHCDICNLWMSAEEDPYHCKDCGFCRVGGSDNFRHCNDCGMCIDSSLFSDHNCKSGKYMSNCPVCQEDLFSSRSASHEMPCGHTIHWHCYQEFAKHDSRCPVCKKTSESPEHMMQTWRAIALSIKLQPVPVEHAKVVDISCNDCEMQDQCLRWHFLGVQCRNCSSFNTNVDRITLTGEQAVLFANQVETLRAHMIRGGLSTTGNVTSVGEVMQGPARSMSQRGSMVSNRSSITSQSGSVAGGRTSQSGDDLIVDFNQDRRRNRRASHEEHEEEEDEDNSMDLS